MKNLLPVLLGSLLFVFVLLASSYAQIGEVAGPMNFNVSLGSSESLTLTIINGGGDAIEYMATPTITTSIPNSTAPQVSVIPTNGSIAPHSQARLNVTAYIPGSKNKPGMVWNGYVSVVEVSNVTVVSGARIQAGALKMFTITAAAPKFQPLYVLVAMLAVAGIGLVAYRFVSTRRAKRAAAKKVVRRGAKMRAARKARKGQAKRRKAAASRARKTTKGRRATRRKR